MRRHASLIGRLLVPDVLRPKPIPQWQQPLEETGSRKQRFARFLWRAYWFSQHRRRADLPGPALDVMVILSTLVLGLALLVT